MAERYHSDKKFRKEHIRLVGISTKKRRKRYYERLKVIKNKPCKDCGLSFPPCVMDFDHKPGTQKRDDIASLIGRGVGWETLLQEIKKCELVCSNCHRIRTDKRRKH